MKQAGWFYNLEQAHLEALLRNHFGYYLTLLGGADLSRVDQSPVTCKFIVSDEALSHDGVIASWDALPFAPDSVDVIVLLHALEKSKDPEAVLAQCQQALRHDGSMIIVHYNPARKLTSGLWEHRHQSEAFSARCWSYVTLSNKLMSMGLEVQDQRFYGFWPRKSAKGVTLIERLGERCLPWFSTGYMMLVRKHSATLTPLNNKEEFNWFGLRRPVPTAFRTHNQTLADRGKS